MVHPTNPGSGTYSGAAGPGRIGRYTVVRELGRGGMGVVYEGLDTQLDRRVAIKVLLQGGEQGPEDLARFEREARTVAKLDHDLIVRVFDVGVERGRPFIVMEFVEGQDLRVALKHGVEPETALRALADAATALAAAHAAGVVHRDVKPENILIRGDTGRGALMDFGVAKTGDIHRLTQTGMMIGTPDYMAPEQLDGDTSSASDVYALGATLYDILTGRPPFVAATMIALITMITTERVEPPSAIVPDVSPRLEQLALTCLSQEVEARPTAQEVARELEAYLAGGEEQEAAPKPLGPVLIAVAVVLLLAGAAGAATWALTRSGSETAAAKTVAKTVAKTPKVTPSANPTSSELPLPTPTPSRTATPTPDPTPSGPAIRRTISWSKDAGPQGINYNGGVLPSGKKPIFLRHGSHVGFWFLLPEPNITWVHMRMRHVARMTRPERWSEVSIKFNRRKLKTVRIKKVTSTYLLLSNAGYRDKRRNVLRIKFKDGPSVYALRRIDIRYGNGEPPPLEEWLKTDRPDR